MDTNKALSELTDLLNDLIAKEELCHRGLLMHEEFDKLYEETPKAVERYVKPLNDISNRIFASQIQRHNAITKMRDVDLTSITSKKEFQGYMKPWMVKIEEILKEYTEPSELDNTLADKSFDWLDSYPEIKQGFISIQTKLSSRNTGRDTMDDIRLLLENFWQKVLGNKKSLENQYNLKGESLIKTYLKDKGVRQEKISWIEKTLSSFMNYQNNYVKHQKKNETFSYPEVEFSYLQAGSIIRYVSHLS